MKGREHRYGQTFGGTGGEGAEPPRAKHTPETVPGSAVSQVVDAIRNTGHEFIFQAVHAFGRTTTERRISKRLHKVRWALEFRQLEVAPAQLQALAMLYGCEMSPSECARRLGISAQAFHERIVRGERRVDDLWAGRVRPRERKGRPNAVLTAPEGVEWMVLRARETLGVGASFIRGVQHLPPLTDEEIEHLGRPFTGEGGGFQP